MKIIVSMIKKESNIEKLLNKAKDIAYRVFKERGQSIKLLKEYDDITKKIEDKIVSDSKDIVFLDNSTYESIKEESNNNKNLQKALLGTMDKKSVEELIKNYEKYFCEISHLSKRMDSEELMFFYSIGEDKSEEILQNYRNTNK